MFYKIFHNHIFNYWIHILSQDNIWYCSILCMDSFQINAVVGWSSGGGQEHDECPTTRSNSCEDKQETVLLTQTAVGEVALISQWDQQIIATAASRKQFFVPEDVCSVFLHDPESKKGLRNWALNKHGWCELSKCSLLASCHPSC